MWLYLRLVAEYGWALTQWRPVLQNGLLNLNDMSCENWKKDIDIWCELTELPKTKHVLTIHLLSGRTRAASLEIDSIEAADLKKEGNSKNFK